MYVVISYYSDSGTPAIMPCHDAEELANYLVTLTQSGQLVQVFRVVPDHRSFWQLVASNVWEAPTESDAE